MPEITVLLPAGEDAAAVEVTARSVFAQTLRDLELLVLDAGAGGGAGLPRLAAEDRRLTVVPVDGPGVGHALNRGLAQTRSPFVARVRAGDLVAPERLERQATLLGAAAELAFVGTGWRELRPDGTVRRSGKPPSGDPALRAAMATGDAIGHPTALMRRGAVTAAGGWRPAFWGAEDYDLLLRLLERHNGTCMPQALVEFAAPVEPPGWRLLEQTLLSEMAAAAAHDRRQIGRPDYGEQASPADRALLHRMGMRAEEITEAVAARAVSAAVAAGVAGEWRAMREAARLGLQQADLPKRAKSHLTGLWLRSFLHLRPVQTAGSVLAKQGSH